MRDSWVNFLDKLIVTTGALLVVALAIVAAVFTPVFAPVFAASSRHRKEDAVPGR